jgi:uncharacterized OsmC-like protein
MWAASSTGSVRCSVIAHSFVFSRVLIIRRVHVVLRLRAAPDQREAAERVHGVFADRCPVYRTLKPAIEITTEPAVETL